MNTKIFCLTALIAALGCLDAAAVETLQPNDALICQDDPVKLDTTRYLRALSLDLRGHLPSMDEIEVIDGLAPDDALPDAMIDEWLASPEFVAQVLRRHRSYFWNNLRQVDFFQANRGLRRNGNIYWNNRRSRTYRTGTRDQVRCFDEPATFDDNGNPVTREDENGFRREGWVEVNPFWAPETTVRVCAFDAQDRLTASDGTNCATNTNHVECGCGPNLNWCGTNEAQNAVLDGLGESLERLIESIVQMDASYLELFESRTGFVNGPLVHYYRHWVRSTDVQSFPSPLRENDLPDIPFTDRDWRQIDLPPDHAGVLTHPAFLLRFQTNRARASRFYETFLCAPFVPPAGGLPAASEESARDPDLQVRAGCKYCHAQLEPAASHWGRWTEQGLGFLNPNTFPALSEECLACARGEMRCSALCRGNYLTRALSEKEEPYLGMLQSYAFRRPDHMHYLEQGPKLLARKAVAENTLPLCVARQTAEWMMGRATTDADDEWLTHLSHVFVHSGFSLRTLVKSIILSPHYRRVQ